MALINILLDVGRKRCKHRLGFLVEDLESWGRVLEISEKKRLFTAEKPMCPKEKKELEQIISSTRKELAETQISVLRLQYEVNDLLSKLKNKEGS